MNRLEFLKTIGVTTGVLLTGISVADPKPTQLQQFVAYTQLPEVSICCRPIAGEYYLICRINPVNTGFWYKMFKSKTDLDNFIKAAFVETEKRHMSMVMLGNIETHLTKHPDQSINLHRTLPEVERRWLVYIDIYIQGRQLQINNHKPYDRWDDLPYRNQNNILAYVNKYQNESKSIS